MTPDSTPPSAAPQSGSSSRRKPLLVAGVGLVALLAGVGLISRRGAEERPSEAGPAAASQKPKQGSSSPRGTSGQAAPTAAGEPAKAPRFDPTTCWQDMDRFNDGVTIHNFREWAAPLLSSRDGLVRDFLKERLVELIGNNP
ncbi:MAG TPA: hypothetical protein VGB96_16540, partial [Archangium sp.]